VHVIPYRTAASSPPMRSAPSVLSKWNAAGGLAGAEGVDMVRTILYRCAGRVDKYPRGATRGRK
jgi:hypothetical protein